MNDLDLRGNRKWKYSDTGCISCKSEITETQKHLFECRVLRNGTEIIQTLNYTDLFDEYNSEQQIQVMRIIKQNFKKR